MNLLEQAAERAEVERARLAAGQRPAPRFQNKLQRTAFKALAVFFVLVLVFTLLSRAAVGVAVARVDVQKPMTGILTQRTTISGSLAAQGDLELTLPGGIRITGIRASVGQRVNAGDVLLELDMEGLNSAIEKLKNEIALMNMRIAGTEKGGSGASADSIINAQAALDTAQEALANAQEDYQRLTQSRVTAEERVAEDFAQAQADYDAAVAALEKAKTRAKEELVKAAQEKLEAVKEALETAKESAKEAIASATDAVSGAQDQETTADSAYFAAINAHNRAKAAYDAAVASGDAAAIAAAQAVLDQAGSSADNAFDASNSASRAVKRAKDTLKTTQEKWDAKVKSAESDVAEATSKLTEVQKKTDMSEETLVISAQSAVDSAQRALKTAQRGTDDATTSTEDQLFTAQRAIDNAQRGVENAQRALTQAETAAGTQAITDQNARRQAEVERLGYVNERRDLQKKLDDLAAAAQNDGKLLAPVAGTVLYLPAETGLTAEGTKVATLSRSDRGFEFKGKVTQEEAEKLAPGDKGSLSFTVDGKSHDLVVEVTALGMADDKGMVELTAVLPEGNYPTGGAAKLEISKRGEPRNTVLPLSALRNDGDDYVLVLAEKQTVMGTEQTVVKVPVTVDERDSESMAVTAPALAYDAKVVVTSDKPIGEGDRVRVNENP